MAQARQSGSAMLSPPLNTATVRRAWRLCPVSMLLAQRLRTCRCSPG